jgi:hypothetical protein
VQPEETSSAATKIFCTSELYRQVCCVPTVMLGWTSGLKQQVRRSWCDVARYCPFEGSAAVDRSVVQR